MKDNGHPEFNFGPHEMTCPQCRGRGKIPYTPEPSNRARSTDPLTSHEGVDAVRDLCSFTADTWRGKLLEVYGALPKRNFTREEAANEVVPRDQDHGAFETTRKRVSELLKVKYLVEVLQPDGKVMTRPNPWSNRESEVLEITPLGEVALKHMRDTGRTR